MFLPRILLRPTCKGLRLVQQSSLSTCCPLLSSTPSSSPFFSSQYESELQQSLTSPEDYWAEIANKSIWTKKWDRVLDDSKSPFTRWFPGGELSLCYNAVDRHVDEGHGAQVALIWDSPITGVLSKHGVGRGDRVLIYMPMVIEAVVAMLATVRLGAAHSVVFGGFAAKELAVRIKHAQPKVIISASCGLEPNRVVHYKPNVDEAIKIAGCKVKSLVFQREQWKGELTGSDLSWNDEMAAAKPHDCVSIEANEPLYILYTSGTTGQPKGVQHPVGGHAVVNRWTMETIYGVSPGETWWAASDLGWIVGHEYICYSPLLARNTSIVYEGKPVGTPDSSQFFRVIEEHKVNSMFTAPTALRAIKREDPEGAKSKHHDISSLKYLFVAGEHCDYDTRLWAQQAFKSPVLDNWWQTETGHALTSTCVGLGHSLQPPKDVSGMAVPGWDIRLPMPPGCMSTLYDADQRFIDTYFSAFPGYYDTMDAGVKDEHGYIKVLARDDDVINVAGHRLSTSAIEEVLLRHPQVVDCAVVGVKDSFKGQLPLGLVVTKSEVPDTLNEELITLVRRDLGAVAAFRLVAPVSGLPRTRSGKTARKTIADLADGKQVKIPPTIEDPSVYKGIMESLKSLGYALEAPQPQL